MVFSNRQPINARVPREQPSLVCATNFKLALVIQREHAERHCPNYWLVGYNRKDHAALAYAARPMGTQLSVWPFVYVLGSEMSCFSSTENRM